MSEFKVIRVKVVRVQPDGMFIVYDGVKHSKISRANLESGIKSGRIQVSKIKVKSLDKKRDDNNNITEYIIADKNGVKRKIKPRELKAMIRNHQIEVVNLKLTSDNRLIDASENKKPKQKEQKSAVKSQAKGITQAPTKSNKTEEPIKSNKTEEPIKSNKTEVYLSNYALYLILQKMRHRAWVNDINISTIGGGLVLVFCGDNTSIDLDKTLNSSHNFETEEIEGTVFSLLGKADKKHNKYKAIVYLKEYKENSLQMPPSCRRMFSVYNNTSYLKEIVFDGLDWTRVETTEEMFLESEIERISIKNSVAPNLINMYGTFKGSEIQRVDLSGLKVPNLERTTSMFMRCFNLNQNKVDLSGLNFNTVKFIGKMFYYAPRKEDSEELQHQYPVDKIIAQCKNLGWKGYPDGREDDFITPLSKPIVYYPDENTGAWKECYGLSEHEKERQERIQRYRDCFNRACFIDTRLLTKILEAYK